MIDPLASLRGLKESVELLASDITAQLEFLTSPKHGVRAQPDELALNFNDSYLLVGQLEREALITKDAAHRLAELDRMLDAMSGESNAAVWTYGALETETWSKVRAKAKDVLDSLGR